jgi:hypothetical protein
MDRLGTEAQVEESYYKGRNVMNRMTIITTRIEYVTASLVT